MSYGFNIGGGSIQLVRDLGIPNSVQGFRTAEQTIGPKLSVPLFGNYLLFTGDGASQTARNIEIWLNVAGVWRILTVWLNVGDGIWKIVTFYLNVGGGNWK